MSGKKNVQAGHPGKPEVVAGAAETADSDAEQRDDTFSEEAQDAFSDVPELTPVQYFREQVLENLKQHGLRIRKDGAEVEATVGDLLTISLQGDTVTVVTVDGQKIKFLEVA